MSKFIKTDKGIFEFKSNMFIEDAVYYCFGKFEKTDKKHLFRNDKDLGEVVKQADTIEELCDMFVLVNDVVFTDPQIIKHTSFQSIKIYREDFCKNKTIYGAISTDKGLIYVAKINSEGELELI